MSDIENIKTVGKNIEKQLVTIRESVGASVGDFSAKIGFSRDEIFKMASASPGKPIIIDGEYCFLYIKDHSWLSRNKYNEYISKYSNSCLKEGRRVHFEWCSTLISFEKMERDARFHNTTGTNRYFIDLRNRRDVPTKLALCQNCLTILLRNGDIPWWKRSVKRSTISLYGDAKEALECSKVHDKRKGDDYSIKKIQDFVNSSSGK